MTFVITIVAALYIYRMMAQARVAVVLNEPAPQPYSRSPRLPAITSTNCWKATKNLLEAMVCSVVIGW